MASIKFPEGTTFRQQYTLYDETGTIIDLTGSSLTFGAYPQGSAKLGHVNPFLIKTIGSGITVPTPSLGELLITFDPHETVDKAGVYEWELQLFESNGDLYEAGTGVLLIQPGRRLDVP